LYLKFRDLRISLDICTCYRGRHRRVADANSPS
jgi:hypothetical protein